jgi:hypothetical protein
VQGAGDHGQMAWNLWVVDDAVRAGRNPYFAPFAYVPVGAPLAQHTLSPGFWPLTAAVRLATGETPAYPLYAYRLAIWLSFTLAAACTWLFLRGLGLPARACLPAVVAYGLCAFARLHLPHLNQDGALFGVPVAALAVHGAWRRPTTARAAGAGAVLAAGVYFSELAVFAWLGLAFLLTVGLALPSTRGGVRAWRRAAGPRGVLAAAGAFVAVLAPFALQWREAEGRAPRAELSVIGSASLAGLVVPHPDHHRLYGPLGGMVDDRLRQRLGGSFLGYPLLVLAGLGLLRARGWWRAGAALAGFYLLLALGPELKVVASTGLPLPYAGLMRIPPFGMGRTPGRCVLLALFPLAALAARGGARLLAGARPRAGAAALALLTVWSLAEAWAPVPRAPVYRPPSFAGLEPGGVVNLPLAVEDGRAALLQVFHRRPMATGYVARRSPAQVAHVRELQRLLDEEPRALAARLRALGLPNVLAGPGTLPPQVEALRAAGLTVVEVR